MDNVVEHSMVPDIEVPGDGPKEEKEEEEALKEEEEEEEALKEEKEEPLKEEDDEEEEDEDVGTAIGKAGVIEFGLEKNPLSLFID